MINKEFCCEQLEALIENPDCPLRYLSYKREYVITVPRSYLKKNEVSMSYAINNCPCCGKAFPQSLSDEWYDIVEEKFGITDFFDKKQLKKITKDFKTDEWWKKRGL